MLCGIWNSPLVVGNSLFVSTEDGEVILMAAHSDPNKAKIGQAANFRELRSSSYYAEMTFEDGVLYLVSRVRLTAIADEKAIAKALGLPEPKDKQGAR